MAVHRSQVDESNGEWLLKKSSWRNPQKKDRVRMPYKRLSLLSHTFSIPKISLISEILSFSTA